MPLTRAQTALLEPTVAMLDLLSTLTQIEKECVEAPTNLTQMVNAVYVFRKATEALDGLRKEINKVEERLAERICTTLGVLEQPNISTEFATASPNSKIYVKFPTSPNTDGYEEFVSQLPLRAVRPHFPTVNDLIAEQLEQGNQLPFGLDVKSMIGVEYKVRLTPKRGAK